MQMHSDTEGVEVSPDWPAPGAAEPCLCWREIKADHVLCLTWSDIV